MPMRARKAPASPLPPSAEGRITRLAAVHVKASCDLNSLLARVGPGPKDIDDPRARMGVQSQITFLERASKAIDDPLLGFHLAETFDPRELGLLYYVQASSVTLGEALARMARYTSVAHPGFSGSERLYTRVQALDRQAADRSATLGLASFPHQNT